jgi:ADP-dependent NAD(P)H-hydrate dehydratase / NAD(P)H-hydrate epimerase
MKVATAEQMQEIDRKAIGTFGIPGIVLMENAGRGAADLLCGAFPGIEGKQIAILAGKGNNGGDGFVIGRHLLNRGLSVRVLLLSDSATLKGDAKTNFEIFSRMRGEVLFFPGPEHFERLKNDLEGADLLVDAIFGTGLNSEVEGFHRQVIEHLNHLNRPVFAVDIPSGLDADTGKPLGAAVRAALTVTFGLPKVGHLIAPGPDYTGELKIIDIGIPANLVAEQPIGTHLLEEKEIRSWLRQPRSRNTHKGDYGHLLVLAGSPGKTGAAAMACEAALRMGAGLVTLGIPESLNPIMEVKLTEAMTEPLPETSGRTLSLRAFGPILELCKNKKAVIIGPGLGTDKQTRSLIIKLVRALDLPIILDADGLNALAAHTGSFPAKHTLILTPHPGEMARLIRSTVKEVQEDRIGVARRFSQEKRVFLVLKGYRTLIATPEGEIFINPTGNPGMASGGTGDVLTGMTGGLACQGLDLLRSLQAAVFLHGMAGDRAAAEKGERSLVATDMVAKIPDVLRG